MIAIIRPAAPDFMTDPNGLWVKETQEAITHYKKKGQNLDYKFKYYNDSRVKEALKLVFAKCAYCESYYADVYDGDVEHFRPKGRVKEKTPQKPGYYWLANDWDNLLLSCQHCNQGRRHLLEGDTKAVSRGKLDQFPIANDKKRAKKPSDSLDEEDKVRYLLNPCKDKPENHFSYDAKEGVIKAETEMGEKSIEVYVLQRPSLVNSRQKRLLELLHQIGTAKEALERYNLNATNDNKHSLDRQISYLLDSFTSNDSPYAGMSRFFVRKFLIDNNLLLKPVPLKSVSA
jgi:uncharacterized protein (TIGR02646 family)